MAIGIDIGAHGATTCTHGHQAVRHPLLTSHERVVFDLLTRVGDQTPMIFWDEAERVQRIQAEQLFVGEILRALMATGHDPTIGDGRGVAVAVPGWWTSRATQAAVVALRDALGPKVTVLSDAEAAVRSMHAEGIITDDTLAVLDVGARTTSAGIVEACRTTHPHQLGRSQVQVDGSGDDLDTRILHRLLAELRLHHSATEPPSTATAQALRRQCHQAKHQLSTDSAATFVLDHAEHDIPIRMVRDELDEIAMPWARSATRLLATAIESSGQDLRSVAVVGGGAHMPLIAQTVSAELGIDVLVGAQPDTLAARGALHAVAGVSHTRTLRRLQRPTLFARTRGRRKGSAHARSAPRRAWSSVPPEAAAPMTTPSNSSVSNPVPRTTSRVS